MITKEYILQCSQAKEIQEVWKLKTGDYIYQKKNKQIYLITNIERKIAFYINVKNGEGSWCYEDNFKQYFIWLLTQGQLWEKIWEIEKTCTFAHSFDISLCAKNIVNLVVRSISNESGYISEYSEDTIQGCLLQYIYETEYSRIWTGEKWAKINKGGKNYD